MFENSEYINTNKKIPEHLVDQSLIWRCQGKNIPVTLRSISNQHGHSTVVLESNVVLNNGEVLIKGKEVTLANEELSIKSETETKRIKAPKLKEKIRWQW